MLARCLRWVLVLVSVSVSLSATTSAAFEMTPYRMREDFGTETGSETSLQYYYYIPCPTYSWFWAVSGWQTGDVIGAIFSTGDQGTGDVELPCDPRYCDVPLDVIKILDFAGYGTCYPGLFTVEMDVYCSDATREPLLHLWNSGPLETHFAWNYIYIDPPRTVNIWGCREDDVELPFPEIIVTMTMTGTDASFPAIGFDNVGKPVEEGCQMHDRGRTPVVYPRSSVGGTDPAVHSGYVGSHPFEFWPPLGLADGADSTPGATRYGFVEVAWRIDMTCHCSHSTHSSTWGGIKSLYRWMVRW